MRVLIVEDERLIAMDIKFILKQMNITDVEIVASGELAVNKTKIADFDLVIMDINLLGEIDGIQAAEKIQKNKKIPVLFCSAYADRETRKRVSKIKHIGFLEKPIEDYELKEFIAKMIYEKNTTPPKIKYSI